MLSTGECPYKCSECGESFRRKGPYDTHMAKHGDGSKKMMCHLCTYACMKKQTLKRHMLAEHGEESLTAEMLRPGRCRRVTQIAELPPEQQQAVRETLELYEKSTRLTPISGIVQKVADKLSEVESQYDIPQAKQPDVTPQWRIRAMKSRRRMATTPATAPVPPRKRRAVTPDDIEYDGLFTADAHASGMDKKADPNLQLMKLDLVTGELIDATDAGLLNQQDARDVGHYRESADRQAVDGGHMLQSSMSHQTVAQMVPDQTVAQMVPDQTVAQMVRIVDKDGNCKTLKIITKSTGTLAATDDANAGRY